MRYYAKKINNNCYLRSLTHVIIFFLVAVCLLSVNGNVLTDTQKSIFSPYEAAASENVANSVTSSPQASTINSNDVWENEDFVPYNSSRHDEFDWKLIKVWKENSNNLTTSKNKSFDPLMDSNVFNILFKLN